MRPDKGAFKQRAAMFGSIAFASLKALQPLYGGKSAFPTKSLGMRDLAQANRLARVSCVISHKPIAWHG